VPVSRHEPHYRVNAGPATEKKLWHAARQRRIAMVPDEMDAERFEPQRHSGKSSQAARDAS